MCAFVSFLALYMWLAHMIGKELITVTPNTLKIKHHVIGFEGTREYDLARVRNLRVSPTPHRTRRFQHARPFDAGVIAFDYGPNTYRFGAGIDESEAAMIVGELKSRHRFFATTG